MSLNGFLKFSACPSTNGTEKNQRFRKWDEIPRGWSTSRCEIVVIAACQ
jgi:hypothetical protein